MWTAAAGLAALTALSAQPATGGLGAADALAAARAAGSPDATSGLFSAGLGFGSIGEDYFARVAASLTVDLGLVGFGIQIPLNIRVIDNPPTDDDDFGGLVREEDWDSVADWLKILRFVYVGEPGGDYYLRVGQLTDLSLGHGTLVHRYRNDTDVNRWRVGLQAEGRVAGVGAQAFVGDLTDPYLLGLRGFARPLEMALGSGPFKGLEIGASVVVDRSAPLAVCLAPLDGDGQALDPGTCLSRTEATQLPGDPNIGIPNDDQDRPQARLTETLALVGVDVGYRLVDLPVFSITPYVDFNTITALRDGWGLHAGVLWQLGIPLVIDQLVADLRTEFRYVSGDYVGPYVNGTYEIERFGSLQETGRTFGPRTKLGRLCGVEGGGDCVGGGPEREGVFLELLAGLPKYIFFEGELLDYAGETEDTEDGTFRLSLEVPALQAVVFSASYFRVGIRDFGDLFALDDRSAVVARGRVPLDYGFYLDATFLRVWRGDPDQGYAPVDDWQVGVGFAVPL